MGHLIRSPLKRDIATRASGRGRSATSSVGEEVVGGVTMGVATGSRARSIRTSALKILCWISASTSPSATRPTISAITDRW